MWKKKHLHTLFIKGYEILLNSNKPDIREKSWNYNHYCWIQHGAKEVFKLMSKGNSVGPNNIHIEVWKYLGDIRIGWITKLINKFMRSNKSFGWVLQESL